MNNVAFCYICFEGNRTLKDLLKSEEECLELMAKLRVCVSEVDWSSNKKLLVCDRCIKKLNKSHEFKKQCIQSSETLKLYLSELKKTKDKQVEIKEEPLVLKYLNLIKDDKLMKKPPFMKQTPDPPTYPAITKIILTQQPNSFPNVFLNIIPQNNKKKPGDGDSNKNPVYNISNVIQFTAQPQPPAPKDKKKIEKGRDEDLTKILTGTKMEEVSVEIDPLDFNMEQGEKVENKPSTIQLANNNFRPILPKAANEKHEDYDYTNEEKMEFFNSGHFLLQDIEKSNRFYCEKCLVRFESAFALHSHFKTVHSSKYPYKCDYCGQEFAAKEMYRAHVNNHCNENSDLLNDSITLTDFTTNSPKINDLITLAPPPPPEVEKLEIKLEEDIKCEECNRMFASAQGLIRHKAKLHKSYQRKKYFVKGMKNAKCDICNRMFSTQSYMNLHRKLHERKGVWRRKIYKPDKAGSQMEEGETLESSEVELEEEEEMVIDEPKRSINNKLLHMDPDIEIIPRNNLNASANNAEGGTTCAYCGDSHEDEKSLQRHIDKIHLKTTQYKCQYCEDAFKLGIHLTKHLSIHTNVTCGTCNENFNTTAQLKVHVSSNHNGKCKQRGRCGVCDKTFDDMEILEGHMDRHTNVYKCHLCSKEYKQCMELTRHLVEHNNSTRKTIHLSDEIEAIPIHQ